MTLDNLVACKFCGHNHGDLCPHVKAYSYDEHGNIIRVEFFAPIDHHPPAILEAARKLVEKGGA